MKFGIELEYTASVAHSNHSKYGNFYEYVLQLMRESAVHDWRYEVDASCGNEIVSPILHEDNNGLAQALQACECSLSAQETYELSSIEGRDAGIHYHFDANDLLKKKADSVMAIRNVLLLSAMLEPLWFSMNPGSRFETAFAAPLNFNLFQMVRARDMVDIRDIWFRHEQGVRGHSDSYRIEHNSYSSSFINNEELKPDKYDWTRYHGMNLVALWKHGTFEFRYTHGSFNPRNVEQWFHIYRSVVQLAREVNTRPIVRAMPINIEDIKCGSIKGLHDKVYYDLNTAINFMFRPHGKKEEALFAPNSEMLHFILKRLLKFNPGCLPPKVAKLVWEDDGTDFERLMGYIRGLRIESAHYARNRYRWTPRVTATSNQDTPSYLEEAEAPDAYYDEA